MLYIVCSLTILSLTYIFKPTWRPPITVEENPTLNRQHLGMVEWEWGSKAMTMSLFAMSNLT